MTILEFLRTASEDEIIEKMAGSGDKTNNLSMIVDSNFISPFTDCCTINDGDECRRLEYYEDGSCFCALMHEDCPYGINLDEVFKRELKHWLNEEVEFQKGS